MIPTQRQEFILDYVREEGVVEIKILAAKLNTSESTVRRDLKRLANQNIVRIDRGAATTVEGGGKRVFQIRGEGSRREEKQKIARKAAGMIREGETIALDTGSTVLELARAISAGIRLTCLTNSLVIAGELSLKPKIETILIGGSVNSMDMATSGPIADAQARKFNVSKFFMGTAGISKEKGITNLNLNLIQIRQTLIEISDELIVLADDSKFGKAALTKVAGFSKVSKVVSNGELPEKYKKDMAALNVNLVIAS